MGNSHTKSLTLGSSPSGTVSIGESHDGSTVELNLQAQRRTKLDLHNLDLANINLDSLVSWSQRNLKEVNLSHNQLESVEEILCQFTLFQTTTHLDISFNKLTCFPETPLYNLVKLQLQNNQLVQLPKTITKLKKLRILDVSYNQLTSIPSDIEELSTLVVLELRNNPLTSVPFGISKLKFLQVLSLDDCPLYERTPKIQVAKIPTLKELAARVIIRHKLPVSQNSAPMEVLNYLTSSKKCSFCSGPYFEESVSRIRFVKKGRFRVPLEHKLCTNHWDTEKKRVLSLFLPYPSTSPQSLPISSESSIVYPQAYLSPFLSRRASLVSAENLLPFQHATLVSLQEDKTMSRNGSNVLREST